MDKHDNYEKTEDFTELFNNNDDDIESLENTIEILESVNKTTYQYDDDFAELVKKRDYRGKNELDNQIEKPHSKKRKLKKWVYVLLIFVLIGGGFGTYKIINDKNEKAKIEEESKLLATIKSHYFDYVKTVRDTALYKKEDNEFVKVGDVYKDVTLNLDKQDIDINTKYFHIKDLDYYVFYGDLVEGTKIEINDRYKKYLPFNINIVTKDGFTIYDEDNKLYIFNKSMEFPVIINNYDNKYYVEFNNKLVSIKSDDVSKKVDANNTTKKNQSRITTLCYHRVYDTDEKCTDPYVCIKKSSFDEEMKYLSDNNYLTLTMDEMYMYMKGYLQVEKAVTITLDDGYLFKSADEVLDKYKLNGTMFVITGEFSEYSRFENLKAIEIQSHTHKMHKNYVCSGGNQGGAILCASKSKIVDDLKTSLNKLGVEPKGLAFPFYDYNENAINALKEVGFKMSFIGRAGVMGRATPKVTDLYKIPRMTVWEYSLMSFNTWKSYL